jgi:hypothetical protein
MTTNHLLRWWRIVDSITWKLFGWTSSIAISVAYQIGKCGTPNGCGGIVLILGMFEQGNEAIIPTKDVTKKFKAPSQYHPRLRIRFQSMPLNEEV